MDRVRDLARERDMRKEREKEVAVHLSPLSRKIIHPDPYPHAHLSPNRPERLASLPERRANKENLRRVFASIYPFSKRPTEKRKILRTS